MKSVSLDAGSGGRASQRLISQLFLKYFDNPYLNPLNDAALLNIKSPLAFSTDSYVVTPLEFNGGNIGSLAVHGTVNDIAMLGAKPRFISAACILEEGLDLDLLERIVISMSEAAKKAGVYIVTGDTKVVPKQSCDKIFINTSGIGEIICKEPPSGQRAKVGDSIIVSGTLGDHSLAIMAGREQMSFLNTIVSDSASLNHITEQLVTHFPIHVLRDPTRGGLASTLGEIASQSQVDCILDEQTIPLSPQVRSVCSFLGLDPLYLANEGKFICIAPAEHTQAILECIQSFPEGKNATSIGHVAEPKKSTFQVLLQTKIGGLRILPLLEGAQLPRIC